MTDKDSKNTRSETMRAVKSKHTRLEDLVINELHEKSIRFGRNVEDLKGKPDIAIKKYKIVIFIDSCFWHGCNLHLRMPKTNVEYWTKKITRNKQRDNEINTYYQNNNWKILRIWEHQIKNDFDKTIADIVKFIGDAKINQ